MEINGVYELNTEQNSFFECDCWSYEKDDCSARVLCSEGYTDPKTLVAFIEKKKANGTLDEDGLFLAVVFKKGKLYLFADRSTSQWVLYYTQIGGRVYYSTSLKNLLKTSGIERQMDLVAAKGFLQNGIVLGDRTLVSDVKKLDACRMIVIQNGKIKKKQLRYATLKKANESELIPTLRESVRKFSQTSETVYMPLSGGFDSNLILDTLIKEGRKINAFTVGGKVGKNEIPLVKENIKDYPNITHHTGLIDSSAFSKLPEIVWRLDGYVYERGIFLQYLLARLVAESGAKTLICGECSDEHQNLLYAKEQKRYLQNNLSPLEAFDELLQPYTEGNFVVLKKSALMLNSFGVTCNYPFATRKFTDVAAAVGKKNLNKKLFYIEQLKKELPPPLYKRLMHAGGSTSVKAFLSESDAEKLKEFVRNSELINRIKKETPDCHCPFWVAFSEQYLTDGGKNTPRVALTYFKYKVKCFLTKLHLYSNRPVEVVDSRRTNLIAYYLILFHKLFLTEKFDQLYANQNDPSIFEQYGIEK